MCGLADWEAVMLAKASLSPAAAGLGAAVVLRFAAASTRARGAVVHSAAQTVGCVPVPW